MNSNPSYTSQQYTKHFSQVELVNNLYSGVDEVMSYLTKFPRETESAYYDRQTKATLKNFIKRVATSTRNVLISKPPVIEVSPKIDPMLESIDRKNSIEMFMRSVALYQTIDGFCYVAIDAPRIDESIQSRADEQAKDVRPYMYIIRRNNVVNWKQKNDGSFIRLTVIEAYEKSNGKYDDDYGEQYRTFFDDGTVEVWRDGSLFETIYLGVDFIPIVKIGNMDTPPLYDIAKLNINHYNRRSNLDRYLTISALPVPVMYGNTMEGDITIGVDDALVFSDKTESGFEWVELNGNSIKSLHEDLAFIEESILSEAVILTSNDLTVAKNEAQVNAETIEGFGRLTHLAVELEYGINKAISYLGKFIGVDDVGMITVNKDFKSNKLSSDEVKDIISLHSNGIISIDTALQSLIEGQIVDIEDTEVEKAKLNNAM